MQTADLDQTINLQFQTPAQGFPMVDSPYLVLRNVAKGFGPPTARTEVLTDINLSVKRGEFVAIIGRSGSGKTTLLSLIAGLLTPDAGEIYVEDRLITKPGPDRGVVFQTYSLLPWMTVFENISVAVDQLFPQWNNAQKQAYSERMIAMMNLTAARNKLPRELSGGMRQRVTMARVLAMDPEILLLDEPLGALDELTRSTLQGEIERIWKATHKTILLITNDVDEGILLADRIIPLTAGPRSTLGPEFLVDIERPRNRQELKHDPRFKTLRREIWEHLSVGRRDKTTKNLGTEQPSLTTSLPTGASV
jgi:nitrate/nitrite transport system ATP-binding protein